MTLTHNTTLDWADAATDEPRHDGLTPVRRAGRPRDEPAGDARRHLARLARDHGRRPARLAGPVIASHSSAFALCPSPRNVPDDILKQVAQNGGVVMVNFYSGFIVPEAAEKVPGRAPRARRRSTPTRPNTSKAHAKPGSSRTKLPRGTVADVADHIDHIVKVAGIDHVGIGSDFDGITTWPVGLEDVSCFPRLTEELLSAATPRPTSTRSSAATSSAPSARPAGWPSGSARRLHPRSINLLREGAMTRKSQSVSRKPLPPSGGWGSGFGTPAPGRSRRGSEAGTPATRRTAQVRVRAF